MIALVIVLLVLAYAGVGFQIARHLTGQSKYREWLEARTEYYRSANPDFEKFVWRDEGEAFFGWLLLSMCLMPLAAALVVARNSGTGLAVAPKPIRAEIEDRKQREANIRKLKERDEYIHQLENELKVGADA